MATKMAFRHVSRRFSSGGKVLGEEEKAAENIYIKKMEQEKLEKLARKGPKPEEASAEKSSTAAKPSAEKSSAAAKPSAEKSSTAGVSTDKYRNYAVLAGTVTILGALGWYQFSKEKKAEVQN